MNAVGPLLAVLIACVVGALMIAATVMLAIPLFKLIGLVFKHVFRFIGGEIGDALRLVGSVLTLPIYALFVLLNIVIGRWSASAHFGRAVHAELLTAGACIYRIAVGHPVHLFGLGHLTEGLERRVPEVMAAAPTSDKPRKGRTGQFEGYTITGSLAGGGSGGKLYIAQPDELKLAAFARNGQQNVEQVVIKTFSLKDGSSLPQIVRESRALDAAKRLGLVLEHELTEERFHYVMRYVPGESLGLVTQRLHALSGDGGLGVHQLRQGMGYVRDLLETLSVYHQGGLWHKDVKPDNIIIEGNRAHLVDLGLITPLRSAMTLTTHGTEYFRDPELVRLALQGVKVHQVDGAKFDLYAAGAVAYSIIENSFPAHGGLSQVTQRCPDALRWIVRRAMTDYDKRYESATAMLADLAAVLAADDPFALKPIDLPSMKGGASPEELPRVEEPEMPSGPEPVWATTPLRTPAQAASFTQASAAPGAPRRRPRLQVTNWWTGSYERLDAPPTPPARPAAAPAGSPRPQRVAPAVRRPASEQLASARARAQAARQRAHDRMHGRARRRTPAAARPIKTSAGVGIAFALFLGAAMLGGLGLILSGSRSGPSFAVFDAGAVFEAPAPAPQAAPTIPATAVGLLQTELDTMLASGSFDATDLLKRLEQRFQDNNLRLGLNAPSARLFTAVVSASASESDTRLPLPPLVQDRTCLVVDEVSGSNPGKARSALSPLLDRLTRVGFRVLGFGAAAQQDRDLVAKLASDARYVRGVTPIDSPSLHEAFATWIDATPDVDMIVWIEPSVENEPRIAAFFGSAPVGGTELEQLDHALQKLAIGLAAYKPR